MVTTIIYVCMYKLYSSHSWGSELYSSHSRGSYQSSNMPPRATLPPRAEVVAAFSEPPSEPSKHLEYVPSRRLVDGTSKQGKSLRAPSTSNNNSSSSTSFSSSSSNQPNGLSAQCMYVSEDTFIQLVHFRSSILTW